MNAVTRLAVTTTAALAAVAGTTGVVAVTAPTIANATVSAPAGATVEYVYRGGVRNNLTYTAANGQTVTRRNVTFRIKNLSDYGTVYSVKVHLTKPTEVSSSMTTPRNRGKVYCLIRINNKPAVWHKGDGKVIC